MEARKLSESDKCEVDDCESNATEMVFSRNKNKVIFCCDMHSDIVIDEGCPEYWDDCANCGCRQGVN